MPVENGKSIVKNEGSERTVLPEGMYVAEVVDVILKENQEGFEGKLVDKFWFKIGILDEEHRGVPLMHFVSKSYTANYNGKASKLYELVSSVVGENLNDKDPFDVNLLIGGRFRIVVKHKESNGKTYMNITSVMKADANSKKLPELSDSERERLAIKEENSASNGGVIPQVSNPFFS